MTGQQMEKNGGTGNREWFTGEHRKVSHESRAQAAENVNPNETGPHPLRRRTDVKLNEPFVFVSYDDEAVRDQIRGRLAGHPLIDSSRISVQVNNGSVLLSGAVMNVREREIAEDVAAGTRGVVRVRCDVRVMRR
jgi:osmotically-inducible protein OsmY